MTWSSDFVEGKMQSKMLLSSVVTLSILTSVVSGQSLSPPENSNRSWDRSASRPVEVQSKFGDLPGAVIQSPYFGSDQRFTTNPRQQSYATEATVSRPISFQRFETGNALYDLSSDSYPAIPVQVRERVVLPFESPNGFPKHRIENRIKVYPLTTSLDELTDDPEVDERAIVRAITAARHDVLLNTLEKVRDDEEKRKKLLDLIRGNYQAHYAAETEFRATKVKELQDRLTEVKTGVEKRIANEENYLEAAMKLVEMAAEGMDVVPPALDGGTARPSSTTYTGYDHRPNDRLLFDSSQTFRPALESNDSPSPREVPVPKPNAREDFEPKDD